MGQLARATRVLVFHVEIDAGDGSRPDRQGKAAGGAESVRDSTLSPLSSDHAPDVLFGRSTASRYDPVSIIYMDESGESNGENGREFRRSNR